MSAHARAEAPGVARRPSSSLGSRESRRRRRGLRLFARERLPRSTRHFRERWSFGDQHVRRGLESERKPGETRGDLVVLALRAQDGIRNGGALSEASVLDSSALGTPTRPLNHAACASMLEAAAERRGERAERRTQRHRRQNGEHQRERCENPGEASAEPPKGQVGRHRASTIGH